MWDVRTLYRAIVFFFFCTSLSVKMPCCIFMAGKIKVFPPRYSYECICADGLGGINCDFPGCGGSLQSLETPQVFSAPNETDHLIGCTWTIDSPADSRINLAFDIVDYNCEIHLTIVSGWYSTRNSDCIMSLIIHTSILFLCFSIIILRDSLPRT